MCPCPTLYIASQSVTPLTILAQQFITVVTVIFRMLHCLTSVYDSNTLSCDIM